MGNNRKIDFSIGIFDEISETITDKIKSESERSELYGVGVYTDKIVIEKYMTYPGKKIKERMELAKQIEGVDFVFEVNSTDIEEIKKIVEKACMQKMKNK